jgi:gluconolactonase
MSRIPLSAVEIYGQGVLRSEGIVVDKDGYVYGAGRKGIVYRVSPDGQVEEIATLPSGSFPNGVAMDLNGDLIICDIGLAAVIRLTQSGKFSLIADRVGDVTLTVPNFSTFDADGNLYVSNTIDRPRREWSSNPPNLRDSVPTGALVRIRPNGKGDVVARDIHYANGTAIDPREEAIYVLETNRFDCLRISIKKDGSHGVPEIFSKDFPACPDGMAFAADGTLFITLPGTIKPPWPAGGPHAESIVETANKIIRVDAKGNWELLIDDPASSKLHNPTNCAFGGPGLRDIYFANLLADHFCRTRLDTAGHPLYHQR